MSDLSHITRREIYIVLIFHLFHKLSFIVGTFCENCLLDFEKSLRKFKKVIILRGSQDLCDLL